MTQVSQAGLLDFVRNVMGIDPVYFPDASPLLPIALGIATSLVNPALGQGMAPLPGLLAGYNPPAGQTPANPPGVGSWFAWAVYNLAGDMIINFAVDQSERTYFKELRASLGLNRFTPGVTSSSSDGGTSQSTLNPEFMKTLTLANLQNLKTPYGRQYLMMAQAYGTLWGLS